MYNCKGESVSLSGWNMPFILLFVLSVFALCLFHLAVVGDNFFRNWTYSLGREVVHMTSPTRGTGRTALQTWFFPSTFMWVLRIKHSWSSLSNKCFYLLYHLVSPKLTFCCISQTVLKILIFLLLPPECWDYKHASTYPAGHGASYFQNTGHLQRTRWADKGKSYLQIL